jgi:hypothetical protein
MKLFKEARSAGLKFRSVAASTAPKGVLQDAWADTVQARIEAGFIRLEGRENRHLRRAYNRLRAAESALQIAFYDTVAN